MKRKQLPIITQPYRKLWQVISLQHCFTLVLFVPSAVPQPIFFKKTVAAAVLKRHTKGFFRSSINFTGKGQVQRKLRWL